MDIYDNEVRIITHKPIRMIEKKIATTMTGSIFSVSTTLVGSS